MVIRVRVVPLLVLCMVLLSSVGADGASAARGSGDSGGASAYGSSPASATATGAGTDTPAAANVGPAPLVTAVASAIIATSDTPVLASSPTPSAPSMPVSATATVYPVPSVGVLGAIVTGTPAITPTAPTVTAPPSATTPPIATSPVTATATAPDLPAAPVTSAETPITPVVTLNAAATITATEPAYGRLPLSFEPNVGQVAGAVQFLARGPGFALRLRGTDATLALRTPRAHPHDDLLTPGLTAAAPTVTGALPVTTTAPVTGMTPAAGATPTTGTDTMAATTSITVAVVRLRYAGANPNPQAVGEDPLPGVANYFVGADPRGWHTSIPTYARVAYHDVYPGVDLVYYGTQGQLEYDWRVAPGADPTAIALAVDGARGLSLDGQGNLLVRTDAGMLTQHVPVVYQEVDGQRHAVSAGYTLTGANAIGFALGAYDASRPLVIDPVLSYSTYLGGGSFEHGDGIAVDAAGDAYVSGETFSGDFPTTPGSYNQHGAPGLGTDAFVVKLNPSGTALLYSTYLGGGDYDDRAYGLAVDAAGDAYVTGSTSSTTFPTTPGAYMTAAAPGNPSGQYQDGFVSELNPTGTALLASTYLGGTSYDYGVALKVDAAGNVYVGGLTYGADFPTTAGAYMPVVPAGAGPAATVTKLTPTLGALTYSTYLAGANGGATLRGLALDAAGAAYITGYTSSTAYPTTAGAFQTHGAASGYTDAVVTKLNAAGSGLVYSTYLGGSSGATPNDYVYGIALDGRGDAYVTGNTSSADFPTTPGAYNQYGAPGSGSDAFVAELNPSGSGEVYGTYLGGGNADDIGYAIALDAAGDATVAGDTYSTSFPTRGAFQGAAGGGEDAFVARLNPTGTGLLYGSYLGGSGDDEAHGVAVDAAGAAYVIGNTSSTDFPTASPRQGTAGGSGDAFIAKVAAAASGTIPWRPHNGGMGSVGNGVDLSVDLADGHADVTLAGLSIPGRGPDLTLDRTWDSTLAQAGAGTNGTGLTSSLTHGMGGVLTGTVLYTDTTGAVWPFVYAGNPAATAPYTAYRTPPGLPWQLATSTAGYTLTDFLTSEVWAFDAQGRLASDTDSYGNRDTLSYGSGSATSPSAESNSGGRGLTFGYTGGLLTDARSPLWQSGGAGAAASQHVTYGYTSGRLTSETRGAGTADAVTTTFGYSGTLLVTITTPAGRAWALGYDPFGRVVALTSPASGTVGRPGYTPAYTTTYSYGPAQTVVVRGAGTTAALTATYTLDAQGEALATTDGLGHSTTATYDADHDALTSADANGATTTDRYQYIGPNGYSGAIGVSATVGQLVEGDQPAIQAYSPLNTMMTSPVITHTYDPATHDLLATGQPEGGLTKYAYDGHHSVVSTVEQTTPHTCATACSVTWRGALTAYDGYGERVSSTDGRGVSVDQTGGRLGQPPGERVHGSYGLRRPGRPHEPEHPAPHHHAQRDHRHRARYHRLCL